MDPISITASIVSAVELSAKVLSTLKQVTGRNGIAKPLNAGVFDIYTRILSSLASSLPHSSQTLPDTVIIALQDCIENLHSMQAVIAKFDDRTKFDLTKAKDKLKYTLTEPFVQDTKREIERHIQVFIEQARALVDLVNLSMITDISHTVHALHYETSTRRRELDLVVQLQEALKDERLMKNENDDDYRQNLHDLGAQLRSNILRSQVDEVPAKDPFAFTARIVDERETREDDTVVRGIMDTGCWDNWISMEAVTRSSCEDRIEPVDNDRSFMGFGGSLKPVGKITVTWYTVNSAKSRKTEFLIHEQGPYDLLLGKVFIRAENLLVFHEPALALRHANLSKAELEDLGRKAKEKKDSAQVQSAIRKAKDADARDRMRREKEASRLTTPASMLSRRSSFLYPHPNHTIGGPSNLSRTFSSLSVQSSLYQFHNASSPDSGQAVGTLDAPQEAADELQEDEQSSAVNNPANLQPSTNAG